MLLNNKTKLELDFWHERYQYYSATASADTPQPSGLLEGDRIKIQGVVFESCIGSKEMGSYFDVNDIIYFDKGETSESAANNLRDAINDYHAVSSSDFHISSSTEGINPGHRINLYMDVDNSKGLRGNKLNQNYIIPLLGAHNKKPNYDMHINSNFVGAVEPPPELTSSIKIIDSTDNEVILEAGSDNLKIGKQTTEKPNWIFKNDGNIEFSPAGDAKKTILDVKDGFKVKERSATGVDTFMGEFQKSADLATNDSKVKAIKFPDGTTQTSAKQSYYTYHTFYYTGTSKVYIPVSSTSEGTSISHRKFLAPHDGELTKIMISTTGWSSAPGSTDIGLHINENTTSSTTGTVNVTGDNTTYTSTYSSGNKFDAGDRISISVDSTKALYLVTMTCMWKYDTAT